MKRKKANCKATATWLLPKICLYFPAFLFLGPKVLEFTCNTRAGGHKRKKGAPPREVVKSLSLGMFKKRLDVVLGDVA